ncbi:coiled-coil domain-containing protein 40-like isoform X2 [Hippocampus zosterae]|uniref:coiled-coil domain-containing protein 40-like isoform X2 n=1 Tax=Hippocampus zosterae TaxID=109293 RepID=UPI00223D3068|nr:coiled-coil domain-containing protein 40-like isoform X2 [Hippocampus zosterae]
MEAEEGGTEQQDENDQNENDEEANVSPFPQDQPGSEPVDADSQPDSYFLTASVETAEDELDVVGGIEEEEGGTEQQDGNEQNANDVEANVSPFTPDQPGSEPVDVVSQPDISDIEDPVMNIHFEPEHFAEVLSPPQNSVEEKEDREPVIDDNEEEDFLVLDAEHPLVAKKQAALKNQLIKELQRLKMQLNEQGALEKAEANQTEELYVELFGEQERLKNLQTRLDGQQKSKRLAEEKHRQVQEELKAMKACHSSTTNECTKTRANVSKLQLEFDKLKLHVNFTQEVSEDLHANVKATKNATRKIGTKKSKAEDQKLKQDLYVERLTKELDRLKQQMDLFEVQTHAQAETTLATKEALSEAEMQMESLAMAQKQLLQQWNRSLLNMRKQDEEFGAMQQAVCMAEHQVIILDREIEGNKKSISELQEKSETLTMMLNCAQMDCEVTKKMITQKQSQHEILQDQYSVYIRALGQTEQTLAELTKKENGLQVELTDQRRKLEKNKNKHLELENAIMTQMLQKLMDNKAAQYYQRLTNKKASLKKEKFYQLWQLESSVMAAALESNVINEKLENLDRTQKELDEEIRKYNKVVASNQTNSSSIDALIAQKQTTIANINKKIDLIAARTGHEDLSPLQIKIEAIKTQIETLSQKMKNDQQLWLKLQGTLIGLTLEIQTHNKEYNKLQTKYTAVCQKKLYLERQLDIMHREENEVEKSNKMLQRDLLKLNTLLSKNTQLRYALEQENAVMETEFLHKLKEAERESIEMEAKLEKTQEEKEKLLSSLVEAERQIMLWEKKTHVMKETRLVVQEGQGDIQIMRDDVHRMERWLSLLMRQREQLLRDSISVVERRGNIIERNEVMARSTKKATTKGELHLMNDGLRRKITEIHKLVKEYDQEIRELQEGQEEFQNKAKKIEEMIDGTPSTTASLEAALQGETERVHTVSSIIQRVWVEMPKYQGSLWKVLRSLTEYTESEDGSVHTVG